MNIPEGILCSKTHEWVQEGQDASIIGLTDWAVEQLGDVVFIELPEVGSTYSKDEVFATIESGLGFFVPKEKEANYNGKELILAQKTKQTNLRKKLFAFIMEDRQIARADYEVYIDNNKVGYVTSGAPSPTLGKNIGFCMINFENLSSDLVSKLNNVQESLGITMQIMVRNKLYNAKIVKKPFIQKKYNK